MAKKEQQRFLCVKHLIEKSEPYWPQHPVLYSGMSLCPEHFKEIYMQQKKNYEEQVKAYEDEMKKVEEARKVEAAETKRLNDEGTIGLIDPAPVAVAQGAEKK